MSGAETEDPDDFILKDPLIDASRGSMVARSMQDTESTISVNWMGGGQIKRPDKMWDIETLFETAAKFPSSVAACPQRTWAILTPYTSNRSFVECCTKALSPPKSLRYDLISGYTAELFDNFMDYKKLLKRVQDIISRRSQYRTQRSTNAITLDIWDLVSVRQALRDEQSKIVEAVEVLSRQPSMLQRTAAWSTTSKNPLVQKIIQAALGVNVTWNPSPGLLVDVLPLLPVTTSDPNPVTTSTTGTGTSNSSSGSGVPGGSSTKDNTTAASSDLTATPTSSSDTAGNPPATGTTASVGSLSTSQTASLVFNFETLIPPAIWEDVLPELKSGLSGSALASRPNLGSGVGDSTGQPVQAGGTLVTESTGVGLLVTRTTEEWNKLLQDVQNKLTAMTSERDGLKQKLADAEGKAATLQKSVDTLTATNRTQADQITQKDKTISQLTADKFSLNTQLTTAQNTLTSKTQEVTNLGNQINQLTQERNDLETKWDDIPSFQVLSVTWGPKQLVTDPKVVAKIEDFAKNKGRTLEWTSKWLGVDDPSHGIVKWGSAVWWFKNDDHIAVSRFEGWEGTASTIAP